MNYFTNNKEEKSLIEFISKYQYLNISNVKYFFCSKRYFRNRISNLISKRFIKKLKSNLVLDELGIEYVKFLNLEYNKLNRNSKYLKRLLFLSNLGAFYHNCNTVRFTPSFAMKDKEVFTITARRFIGVLEINNIDYLTYSINKNHDNRYIQSIIYDIQKEKQYKNIIILVNDINRININDFSFGMNRVLLVEDNLNNRESLKYLHSVDWSEIISQTYKNKIFLSEYNFCDYTDYKNKYINTFYFLDTEKINRIKYFLRENKNKNIDIICNKEIEFKIRKELPNCNYITVDLEKYINKERKIYD